MEKDLDITKHRNTEQILPVPWPFDILRFHCRFRVTFVTFSFNLCVYLNFEI